MCSQRAEVYPIRAGGAIRPRQCSPMSDPSTAPPWVATRDGEATSASARARVKRNWDRTLPSTAHMLNCCARSLRCATDPAIQASQEQEAAANAAAQREAADAAMKAAFREWRRGRRAEVAENTFMDWYMGELERENEDELCSTFYSWSSMLGQRTNSTHTGCDISHSNSPCPLGPLTTHIPSAISISDTAPLDSRLWSDRTGSTRVAARPVEASTDISAWSQPRVPHASV